MFQLNRTTITKIIINLFFIFFFFFFSNQIYGVDYIEVNVFSQEANRKLDILVPKQLIEQGKNQNLFYCQVNLKTQLKVNDLEELKEKFSGFRFSNILMNGRLVSIDDKYKSKKYKSWEKKNIDHFISFNNLEKEEAKNKTIYKFNYNNKNEFSIIAHIDLLEHLGTIFLTFTYYIKGFTEANKYFTLNFEPSHDMKFFNKK